MGHLRMFNKLINRHGKGLQTLLILACLFSLVMFFETYNPPAAKAYISLSPDQDNDVLPDPFEQIYGTKDYMADSDGDTYIDGIEYVLRSNPFDIQDFPVLEPGMRVAAYKVDQIIKLCVILFPGNLELLDKFVFFMTYGGVENQPNGQSQIDLTSLIPMAISEFSYATFKGYLMMSIVFDIPESVIQDHAPLSIGIGVKIGGEAFADIGSYNVTNGQVVKYMTMDDLVPPGSPGYFGALTPNLPSDWEENQVCKTEMEEVGSNDGIITYEITEAQCQGIINQFCSPSDCSGLVGTQVVSIDSGFIHAALED